MKIANWAQYHRRSLLFLIVLLALSGIVAALQVPVALFPNVEFPRVLIAIDAGDRPAQQMVLEVTRPIEEAARMVPGIQSIRSMTSRGSASVFINFKWGSDTTLKALQINNAIGRILPQLPAGTTFAVRKMSPAVFPILGYSLTSKTVSLTELRTIAQYQLRPLLSSIPGIAQIGVVGGAQAEYHVELIPQRLAADQLSIQDVIQALTQANVLTAVGKLEQDYKLYLSISDTRLRNLTDIGNTVIRASPNGIIRLKDIATINAGTVPQWIRVDADGQDAVLLQVFQQPDGNSVRIARAVKAKLAAYAQQLPAGVQLNNWYDQSQLVIASTDSVRNAILIGVLLAAGVILVFLRNIKITLIAVLVVPASLAITSLLIYALGMSFNIMTLGGMAAAIGLIIDDAIVMIEHIIRRLRAHPDHYHKRVLHAALEFTRPLTASSAATTVIFIPLAFLSGVTGAFFKALSLTMASALITSFLLAWLAIPLLADHFLTLKDATQKERGKWLAACQRYYARLMQRLLKKPALLLLGIVPLLGIGLVAYYQVGSEFMPKMDEGGFNIDYKTPPGTSLTETNRLLQQVEGIIKSIPDVATFSRRTGTTFGGADPYAEPNEGDFIVKLRPNHRLSTEAVINQVRQQILTEVPGIEVDFGQLLQDMIGDLTAVPQPIEVKIYSDDEQTLLRLAHKVAATISHVNGVVDIQNGINPAGDALMIHVDPAKAAMEGVDPTQVTNWLSTAISGTVATEIIRGNQLIGVRVWTPPALHDSTPALGNLMLRAPDGHLFPLKRVATITAVNGQPQLTRENLKPMIAVTARISGSNTGTVIQAIKQQLNQPGYFPQGTYYELGGLYHQQQIAFHALIMVLGAAFALVFLLQLFLYERFRIAIAIMCLPIIAVAAVFIGLWLTGIDLNIAAMMGMTMIVGIITEVAIFYFSELQDLIKNNLEHSEALIQAGINRMRPIVMTTLAAILALLPLALGLGQGATMEQPLAVSIISGLVIQLPLVLLVMPILYHLLLKWQRAS